MNSNQQQLLRHAFSNWSRVFLFVPRQARAAELTHAVQGRAREKSFRAWFRVVRCRQLTRHVLSTRVVCLMLCVCVCVCVCARARSQHVRVCIACVLYRYCVKMIKILTNAPNPPLCHTARQCSECTQTRTRSSMESMGVGG